MKFLGVCAFDLKDLCQEALKIKTRYLLRKKSNYESK